MKKHDTFNASATATWLKCTYSALNRVPDALKKESTVRASEAGTERHAEMELGDVPAVEDFISQLENPASTVREHRVHLTEDCGGTIDIFSHGHRNGWNIATILDGKFGKWDIPAFRNLQCFTYGACMLQHNDAEWWRFVIYQPYGLDEDPWKQWIAHRSEVEAHRDLVLRTIKNRNDPPNPGPHCRWCNAFQACPAMSTDAGFVMGAMARPLESLSPDELVRLLRIIRSLGDVKEVYEEALTVKLKLGIAAKEATLKPERTYRAWNDPIQAATHLHGHYGFKGVKPITPAQAEKLGVAGKTYAAVGAHKPQAGLKASY